MRAPNSSAGTAQALRAPGKLVLSQGQTPQYPSAAQSLSLLSLGPPRVILRRREAPGQLLEEQGPPKAPPKPQRLSEPRRTLQTSAFPKDLGNQGCSAAFMRVRDAGLSLPAHGRCTQTKPEGETTAGTQSLILAWLWQRPQGRFGQFLLSQPGQRPRPGERLSPSLCHPHPCPSWERSSGRACTKPRTHRAQEQEAGKARSARLYLFVSPGFCISPEVCILKSKSTVQIHLGKVFPCISLVEKGSKSKIHLPKITTTL